METRGGQDVASDRVLISSSALRPRGFRPSPPQMNTPHIDTESLGFPTGYFLIKSVATGRILEVYANETKDSSPVALWPVREQSLVESTSSARRRSLITLTYRHDVSVPLLALRSSDADGQVSIFTCPTDGFFFTRDLPSIRHIASGVLCRFHRRTLLPCLRTRYRHRW